MWKECNYLSIAKLRLLIFHCRLTDFLSFFDSKNFSHCCYHFTFKLEKRHEIIDKRPTSFCPLLCFLKVICLGFLFVCFLFILVNSKFQVYNKKSYLVLQFPCRQVSLIWHVCCQKVKSLSKLRIPHEQAPVSIGVNVAWCRYRTYILGAIWRWDIADLEKTWRLKK